MHPVGTNSAASLPKISAARFSSRLTVGSSPYTSSPTSASAMARRIAAVGRVTVSDRRSTKPSGIRRAYRQGGVPRPGVDELVAVALSVARDAAAFLVEHADDRQRDVDTKSSRTDMVTEIDRGSEALITTLLERRRPGDAILGEEGARR